MQKLFILLFVLSALAMGSLSQAQEESGDVLQPWTCPEGFEGQTLRLFSWSTYTAEDTIPNFEEACGVQVDYSIMATNEEMLTIIRQDSARFDLIVASDYVISRMIEEGLLHRLNFENIPNIVHVGESFRNPPFDPTGEYSVPYQWGTSGIGYNTEFVPEGIQTWDDVFAHEGPVAWVDDMRTMFGVALTELGYDPNTTNPDEITAARDWLIEHGGNVATVAQDDGQVVLERGDVDIAVEYSGDIFQIIDSCECDTYRYIIPEDGANMYSDNMIIPATAPNPELAEAFIDYILHPQVGADLSNYVGYGTPNQTAIELGLIDEAMINNPGLYPDENVMERLYFLVDTGEAEALYADAWNEVLVSLGQ